MDQIASSDIVTLVSLLDLHMPSEALETAGRRFVILPLLSHAAVFSAYDLSRGPIISVARLLRVIRTHLLAFDAVLLTPGALVASSNDLHDTVMLELLSHHEFSVLVDAGLVVTFHDSDAYGSFGAYLDEFRKLGGREDRRRVPLANAVFSRMRFLPRGLRSGRTEPTEAAAKYATSVTMSEGRKDLVRTMADAASDREFGFLQEAAFLHLRKRDYPLPEMEFLTALLVFRTFAGQGREGVYSYPLKQLLELVGGVPEVRKMYGGPQFHPVFHPGVTEQIMRQWVGKEEFERFISTDTRPFVEALAQIGSEVDRSGTFFRVFGKVIADDCDNSALLALDDAQAGAIDETSMRWALNEARVVSGEPAKLAGTRLTTALSLIPRVGSLLKAIASQEIYPGDWRRIVGMYALRMFGGSAGDSIVRLNGIVRSCR